MQYQVWVARGDFNMIKSPLEKKGGILILDPESNAIGELTECLRLINIPIKSGLFTWNNKRGKYHRIVVRLDHFLVSET